MDWHKEGDELERICRKELLVTAPKEKPLAEDAEDETHCVE